MQIAIDGPAASGKSTAAKALAKRLGFLYIDTGAMYRAVTLEGLNRKINFDNESEIVKAARDITVSVEQDWSTSRGYRILIDGKDITEKLFTPDVDAKVSTTAQTADVRKILVESQRELAGKNNVVMAGRDIGSNVLKDAELKIFLTASAEKRAERRLNELLEKGVKEDYEAILANIRHRDRIDSGRKDNPLIKTPDAIEVNCTNLSIDEMINAMEIPARKRMKEQV